MKIFKVTESGIIVDQYESLEELLSVDDGATLYQSGDFNGGYIQDVQLAKIIKSGSGGVKQRDVLKARRDLRNRENDIQILEQDLKLQKTQSNKKESELTERIDELTGLNEALTKDKDTLTSKHTELNQRVGKALDIISKSGVDVK